MKIFLAASFILLWQNSHSQTINLETGKPVHYVSLRQNKPVLANRISSSLGLSNVPVNVDAGHYHLSMGNNFDVGKTIESYSLYALNFGVRFFLTRRASLNYHVASANTRLSRYNQYSFGVNWHKRTDELKRPFFFEAGLNLNYFAIGASVGETEIMNPFRVNNKKFSEGITRVYYGERRLGIGPVIQYRFMISSKLSIFANATTTLLSVNKTVVFFKPQGVFTSVRSVPINDDFVLLKNNVIDNDGPVSLSVYGLCFTGGLQFGIN